MSALSTGVFGESREVFLELDFRSGPQHVPTREVLQFALCRSNQSPMQTTKSTGFVITATLANAERVITNCRWGNNRMFI